MNTYVDKIMTNHIFNSESSEDLYYLYSEKDTDHTENKYESQYGGGDENKPTGGFPPIYIVNKKEKDKEITKSRQLSSRRSSVSIRDILKSKK